jgi:hypothetical protein
MVGRHRGEWLISTNRPLMIERVGRAAHEILPFVMPGQ